MLPKHVQTVQVQPLIRRPSLHLLDKTCQGFINQLSEQDLFYYCKNVIHVLHFKKSAVCKYCFSHFFPLC